LAIERASGVSNLTEAAGSARSRSVLGVVGGLHERAPPVLERELAGDPPPALPTPDEVAASVDRPVSAHKFRVYGPTTGQYG